MSQSHCRGPWELMNWINRRKLPATEAIKFNGQPCITPDSLWGALHNTFNHAINRQVDVDILNEIENKSTSSWEPFSKFEFRNAISKCNNLSAPGPDKFTWRHLKHVLKQEECLLNIINIANTCINLGHWPNYFKCSLMVIIPKPNKPKYDHLKAFRPIVLLNTLGKLIEKVIAERLQFIVSYNNFIYPSQLGSLKFKSTLDAGVALTHIVHSGWAKNKSTSILAFNITQFFPSLSHHLLTIILEKAGLEPKVASFFVDYLVNRKTNYNWNELSSPIFKVNVGVGQGSALSPILSALYLSPLLYILEKHLKNLKIPISFISFVNDGLFIAQNKSIVTLNSQLFCSYNILSKLLDKFGLIVEHSKTDIFHFNRSLRVFNLPPLNLSAIGGPILKPKDSWKYLGFIFDWKLNFHQHIDFYSNKAILTVKSMKLLGNLLRGINPIQKCLLYRCCILPIMLYGFQLWFYNKVSLSYHMKILGKIQRRAVIWILGAFKTSPSEEIKAIAGLIPIKYHLQKLVGRSQLQLAALPTNYLIRLFMNDHSDNHSISNPYSINSLMNRQKSIAKGHLINSNNKLYRIFLAFSPLHMEFNPGSRITDKFSGHFAFNLASKDKNDKKHSQQLNEMTLQSSSSPNLAIVVIDASIKNDIATSISHIHIHNHPLTKMVHHAAYVTSTEAELFAIRCSINQACSKNNISKIIVVTNSIHAAKKIFESSSHPY